ncbi:MAG: hypothetical protein AB1646_25810 [Thermodesulfobacteriota bacterium]
MELSTTLPQLQCHLDAVEKLPIVYWPFNFMCSSVVALVSFLFFSYLQYREDSDFVERMSVLSEQLKWITTPAFILYVILYSVVSAILAAALISMKFKAADLEASIFLGIVGPYALRDHLLLQFQRDLSQKTTNRMTRKRREIRKKSEEDYDQDLRRLRMGLAETEPKRQTDAPKGGCNGPTTP